MKNKSSLHRAVKILLQRERVRTIEEGYELLRTFSVGVKISHEGCENALAQTALATFVNAAQRVFLGGVFVELPLRDAPCLSPLLLARTLGDAMEDLGADISEIPVDAPTLLIGDLCPSGRPEIRAFFSGWSGGIVPSGDESATDADAISLTAVLSASLAASEMFRFYSGEAAQFGSSRVGLSLHDPGAPWDVPVICGSVFAPDALWLLGLGHLGQAYAWSLASIPFAERKPRLMLQDAGLIEDANLSTSVLTFEKDLGKLKTRTVATWLEARGFDTRITERLFTGDSLVQLGEPRILLGGVDNVEARQAVEDPGFDLIVDAGLSPLGKSYDWLTIKTFTGTGRARTVFSEPTRGTQASALEIAAYRSLGLDECGVNELAGVAVGVPFVGLAASTLVLSEVIRALHGKPLTTSMAGRVHVLNEIERVTGEPLATNPGFIEL